MEISWQLMRHQCYWYLELQSVTTCALFRLAGCIVCYCELLAVVVAKVSAFKARNVDDNNGTAVAK